jgi:hypothetical protein
MAISTKEMGRLLSKHLDEIFRDVDDGLRTTWAVYTEFNHEQWRHDITDIVPWVDRNYDSNPFKIEGAIDEMAAYKKFVEGHK